MKVCHVYKWCVVSTLLALGFGFGLNKALFGQPQAKQPAPQPQHQPEAKQPVPEPQRQPEAKQPAPQPQRQPEAKQPAPQPQDNPAVGSKQQPKGEGQN